jgi:hypothetical protein
MRKIMAHHALASQESYNPNHLLDILLGKMQLKNDAALSRLLEVAPPVISKIRHHRLPVGASLLIRMHEVTGMSIRDLRDLMGDRRTKYRLSDAQGRPKPEDRPAQKADGRKRGSLMRSARKHLPHRDDTRSGRQPLQVSSTIEISSYCNSVSRNNCR